MDFKALTDKAKKMAGKATDKVKKVAEDAVEKTAQSFAKSGAFIREDKESTKEEKLKKIISDNKKILVIFGKQESEFFRKALLMFPVLFTKGWAQNFKLKLYPLDEDETTHTKYNVKKFPSLIIFKEGKVSETIEGEDEIMKVVKSLSLEVEGIGK